MNATTKIYDMNNDVDTFPFDSINITKPYNRNGSFFMRIELGGGGSPLYIQPPKCVLKQGFTKSGKKMFCDLVFSNENDQFLEWLEKLEETCYLSIYNHREKWFDPVLEKHEIEEYMTSPFKIIKSGKFFIIRTDISTTLGKCDLKVYDENENEVDHEKLKENTNVLTIIEFKGIKCSVRSFQFELELKQMLVVEPVRLFEKCIINMQSCTPTPMQLPTKKGNEDDLHVGGVDDANTHYNDPTLANTGINETGSIETEMDNVGNSTNTENTLGSTILANIDDIQEIIAENASMTDISANTGAGSIENMGDAVIVDGGELKESNIFSENGEEDTNKNGMAKTNLGENILEVDFDLAQLNNVETMKLKNKNDIYYEKYKEAKQKAKEARILALAHYMEANRIKTTYLEGMDLEESDNEEEEVTE